MSKIAIIDYIGDSLADGKLVGHPVNAGNQYIDMLKDKYHLYSVAPVNEVVCLQTPDRISLQHNAIRNKGNRMQVIKNYINEFKNLHAVWKICNSQDLLFFFNIDYALYLFLLFHKKRRVICHTYTCVLDSEAYLSKTLKRILLYCSRKKIALQLFSNRNYKSYVHSSLFVPDFLYRKEVYDKYNCNSKTDKIVCVGTMSNSVKEIKRMVEVFCNKKDQLEIVGQFFDTALFEELVKIKSSNITIRNQFITNDEYYSLIASAKYCILPYRESCYNHKTSGVVLEAIFLNAIPIAPNSILQNNGVTGVGYNDIDELSVVDFGHLNTFNILNTLQSKVSEIYDFTKNAERILGEVGKIEDKK